MLDMSTYISFKLLTSLLMLLVTGLTTAANHVTAAPAPSETLSGDLQSILDTALQWSTWNPAEMYGAFAMIPGAMQRLIAVFANFGFCGVVRCLGAVLPGVAVQLSPQGLAQVGGHGHEQEEGTSGHGAWLSMF